MNDDVLMASLCGCVVLRIVTEERTVRLELDDPRLGRFQLQCEDAAILTRPSSSRSPMVLTL